MKFFKYFIDIDDCKGGMCVNGGKCSDKVNGFQCSCPAGYTGTYCQKGMYINSYVPVCHAFIGIECQFIK